MKWQNLHLLWIALPTVLVAWLAVRERLQRRGVVYSLVSAFRAVRISLGVILRHLPLVLRLAALSLLVIAILRPQALMGEDEVKLKGVNIMLVTDLSGSMLAEDLKPDRLVAEKKVLTDFVGRLKNDQVGLVIFGAKSFTQSPLTMDYDILANSIQEFNLNTVDADGTAIGDGILNGVARLADLDGETNILVLATDGTNNRGEEPLKAAEVAAAKQIRIYAIGIGAKGGAPVYTKDQFGVKQAFIVDGKHMRWDEPNDEMLTEVATKTGGAYFRAEDEKSLDAIYSKINDLIKDEKKRKDPHYRELFNYFLLAALACLLLEVLLSTTWLRSLA